MGVFQLHEGCVLHLDFLLSFLPLLVLCDLSQLLLLLLSLFFVENILICLLLLGGKLSFVEFLFGLINGCFSLIHLFLLLSLVALKRVVMNIVDCVLALDSSGFLGEQWGIHLRTELLLRFV